MPHTNVLGINFFIHFSFSLCFNSNWCSEFLFIKNYWNFVVYRYYKSWRHAYSISVLWGVLCSCLKSFHACHAFILWNIRTWMRMLVGCKLKGQKKNSIDYSEVMMPRVLAPSSLWVENVITLSANFSRTTNGNWMQLSSAC